MSSRETSKRNSKSIIFRAQHEVSIFYEHPKILIVACLSGLLILTLGLIGVFSTHAQFVSREKYEAEQGVLSEIVRSLESKMKELSASVVQTASVIKITKNCSTITGWYDELANETLGFYPSVSCISFYPSFVAEFNSPPERNFPYHHDYLATDNAASKWYLTQEDVYYSLPRFRVEGFFGIDSRLNIFLHADSYEEDLGCSIQPYNCSDVCWDSTRKLKFFGVTESTVAVDELFDGSAPYLRDARRKGFNIRLSVVDYAPYDIKAPGSSRYLHVYETESGPVDPVSDSLVKANLEWKVHISPTEGWGQQNWLPWAIIIVGFISALCATLIGIILVKKERHQELLSLILPEKVIHHLEKGEGTYAEQYSSVTIFFSDIVGFTTLAGKLEPEQVVDLLDEMYKIFDEVATKHGVYKVETIGDAYMAVAGCPTPEEPTIAARKMASFAQDIVDRISYFEPPHLSEGIQIRVGIHSGPVVAGVVGVKMPRYCLFGDTVNTASRMESNSESMRIHLSENAYALILGDDPNSCKVLARFPMTERGLIPVKGKGDMRTFWLEQSATIEGEGANFELLPPLTPTASVNDTGERSNGYGRLSTCVIEQECADV